jgi:hypothetical protein
MGVVSSETLLRRKKSPDGRPILDGWYPGRGAALPDGQ